LATPFVGDIVDNPLVYAEPGTDTVDLFVTIWPADNPESEEDADCAFITPNDGIGTTLDHVNQDVDPWDNCKPELNVRLEVAGLVDAGGVPNAEMRLRGKSTRFAEQKSYRIKINRKDADGLWRGQRVFNLNKHPYDLTRMRNKLSFDLLSTIPDITSLRTQFVRLHVDRRDGNGMVDFGLFTHVEKVDGYFLEAHGLDPAASVYKAEFFEFERYPDSLKLESDPTFDKDAFESILEIEEGSDHAPLLEMLDAVNDPTSDFDQVFATYFNEANYLTWLACNILFDNLDTNSQNFYLYRPSESKVFYFMPWDYDGAWDFYTQPNEAQAESLGRWQRGISNWWGAPLHARFLRQPGNIDKLIAKMQEIQNDHVTQPKIAALLADYANTVRTRVALTPDLDNLPVIDDSTPTSTLAEYDTEVGRIPNRAEAKFQEFLDSLERPMPVYMSATIDDADMEFRWDSSYDLQGDALTYDFQLSTTTAFEAGDIVAESLGLVNTVTFRYALASLPAGTYYYRVIIRDNKAPGTNWQISFDSYYDELADKTHFGMKQLVIE